MTLKHKNSRDSNVKMNGRLTSLCECELDVLVSANRVCFISNCQYKMTNNEKWVEKSVYVGVLVGSLGRGNRNGKGIKSGCSLWGIIPVELFRERGYLENGCKDAYNTWISQLLQNSPTYPHSTVYNLIRNYLPWYWIIILVTERYDH